MLEVVRVLKETARRPGRGWEPDLGWGVLDVGAAVPDGRLTAGIVRYELWRSAGDQPPRRIARTRQRFWRVDLAPGRRDAFFTIAVDAAGNREAAPAHSELLSTG